MKKNWEIKKLGELCDISTGKWDANHALENGEFRFFTCAREPMLCNTKRFSGECLVLPGNGVNVGDVYYYKGDFDAYQRTYVISKIKPYPKYLFYHMLAFWKERNLNKQYGSATNFLKIGNFNEYEISLPPLPEQKRIVGILDKAFAAISTAKANAEKNLQNARELFESYLQGVFANPGDGWVEMRIADVCTLKSGTTVSAALEKTAGDLPYLKVADMTHAGNEVEIVSSSRFLNKADIGRNAVLPSGTTIFPKRGGAILTNKKRLTAVPICADLNIMGVIPGKSLLPKYLYFYFLNIDMRQIGSGSSIPQINNYDIEPLVISFPKSAGQQAEIVSKLDKLSTETQRLESIYQQKIADLDELKKSVLQKAFNGELAGA